MKTLYYEVQILASLFISILIDDLNVIVYLYSTIYPKNYLFS